MKKTLPAILAFSLISASSWSQTTLFSENFNGNTSLFTLNTSDMSSATAGTNKWIINNAYTGGSGQLICMSFPFTYSIANTVQQPSTITGFPTSKYLHIISNEAETDGIFCSSYLAADGFCNFSENNFTRMTSDISTVGYTNVTLSFWWLCGGSVDGYGEVYFSTDAGLTWTAVSGQYLNNGTAWQLQTVYDSNFDNKPLLRFGYRFVNNTATTAADPGFSIDDVGVTGQLGMGITSNTSASSLSVFPNPAGERLTFNWNLQQQNGTPVFITITDLTGAVVRMEEKSFASAMEISTAELAAGCYLLHVQCGTEESVSRFAVAR
ncbi:MAG TPA: T9SS type A sorting domain-containing protein [Bacteroidia bacterium]|nr:T9SS type A sorting domain-containing protein [Bacteroidia bacterium]